jgi:beta-N-acetylhexosaminidase
MIDVQGTTLTEEDRELTAHPLVGAVILFTRNFESIEQLERLVADVRAIRTPPLLVTVDHEGGRVQRFRKGFTCCRRCAPIGREYDLDQAAGKLLARQCGWLMAAELRAVAIDMSFAPCVDLDYGVSSVIGDRAFHRDPQVVAELAVAFMGGMREAGMARPPSTSPGTARSPRLARRHAGRPPAAGRPGRRPLSLPPADRQRLPRVMAAHVIFEQVDGLPAGFSSRWMQQQLRGIWGSTAPFLPTTCR